MASRLWQSGSGLEFAHCCAGPYRGRPAPATAWRRISIPDPRLYYLESYRCVVCDTCGWDFRGGAAAGLDGNVARGGEVAR